MRHEKMSNPRRRGFIDRERCAPSFKITAVIVALIFLSNCALQTKRLISTTTQFDETRTIYAYQAEEIKKATVQDPIVEFKIIKTPCHVVKEMQTYEETRKYDRLPTAILGLLGGFIGGFYSGALITDYHHGQLVAMGIGSIVGGLSGFIIPLTVHPKIKKISTTQKISKTYPIKISAPVPLQNEMLTVKWLQNKKEDVFKISTDGQGVLRLNLARDLRMGEMKAGQAIVLIFRVMNAATQKVDAFVVSLKIAA